ncbi:MAG: GerMN domain-containing protein [Atribacterota bacterium]
MARRKRKKNNFKFFFNIIILLILLIVIFLLVQKFIIPMWQEIQVTEKVTDDTVEEEVSEEIDEIEVMLYFSDDNAQYLVGESRQINQADNPLKQAIVELIKGPEDTNLYPTVPKTTKVNALYVSEEIAYIDLSSEVVKDHPGGSTGELLTVYSIVMTLTSFSDIEKVQILIEGDSRETLVGHVDVSKPLERDESWIKK